MSKHSTAYPQLALAATEYLEAWYDTLDNPNDADYLDVVSLRKPSHSRPDDMRYVSDFPQGKSIVFVYPAFGDIVRWVPVKDQYGYDQHEAETFPFVMSFTCPCVTCESE